MKTVSFFGTCALRGELTLVSAQVSSPFRLVGSRLKFADGCGNQMRVEIVIGPDSDAPSSGRPNGTSVLSDYGQVRYVVGNDEVVVLHHDVVVSESPAWLKIYADNTDWYEHDVLVQLFIQPLARKEAVT